MGRGAYTAIDDAIRNAATKGVKGAHDRLGLGKRLSICKQS